MDANSSPKCPNCENSLLTVLKEWNYSCYHVKNIKCSTCQETFKAYFKQDKFSHIILNRLQRSPLNNRTRIINYLRKNNAAREEEIANALQLSVTDVIKELEKMEKKGIVDRVIN